MQPSAKNHPTTFVLQAARGNHVYVPVKDDGISMRQGNDHFYPVSDLKVRFYQSTSMNAISVTEEGLRNLKSAFDNVYGAPAFIHRILRCDPTLSDFQALIRHPECFPYFKNEKFLVVPNFPFDPQLESVAHPHRQKLKDGGIVLCAWFIHPNSSSMNTQSKQLLEELSQDKRPKGGIIDRLRSEPKEDAIPVSKFDERDTRTIGELKEHSEYLASIYDLTEEHIPLLMRLKESMISHLKEQYWVNEDDFVNLYFHTFYETDTVTLHLHARVNQGFHPFEQAFSVTIDQVITWLQSGKTINELILKRQVENKGFFQCNASANEAPNYCVPGITMLKEQINENRLMRK